MQFNIKRHWKYCEENGEESVEYSLEGLAAERLLILKGEAGLGKSSELKAEYERVEKAGDNAVFVDLGKMTSSKYLFQSIFDEVECVDPDKVENSWYIFLDAFDEIFIEKAIAFDWLLKVINELQIRIGNANNLYLRVSTRPVSWLDSYTNSLKNALNIQSEFDQSYTLLPFSSDEISRHLESFELQSAPDSRLELLQRPIFLNLFLNARASLDETSSVSDLYETYLRESMYKNQVSADNSEAYFLIIGKLSLISLISQRPLISLSAVPTKVALNQIHWSEVVGGKVKTDNTSWTVSPKMAWSAIERAPIDKEGAWSHKSFPEFMAGYYLAHQENSLELMGRYLGADVLDEWKPAPLTIEVLKWASCYDESIRNKLISCAPEVLINQDLSGWAGDLKEKLLAKLFEELTNETMGDWGLLTETNSHQLNHANIETQLRSIIESKSKGVLARRLAIHLAEYNSIESVAPDLLIILKDNEEPAYIRRTALDVLSKLSPENEQAFVYKDILENLSAEEDPNDELRGTLLKILWPKHLSISELLEYLTPENNDHFLGQYNRFIAELSIDKLKVGEAEEVISWLVELAEGRLRRSLRSACSSLLAAVVKTLKYKKLHKTFVFQLDKINKIGHYFYDEEENVVREASLGLAWSIRREIIVAIFKCENVRYKNVWQYSSLLPFVSIKDASNIRLDFLNHPFDDDSIPLEMVMSLVSHDVNEMPEIWSLLDEDLPPSFANRQKILAEKLQKFFTVELEGDYSSSLKNNWIAKKKREEARASSPKWTLLDVVSEREKLVEKNIFHWWQLDQALLMEENNDEFAIHDYVADISDTHSWQLINDDQKDRYLDWMIQYLNSFQLDEEWLQPNSFNRPAAAGLRALIYICNFKRDELAKVSDDAWAHWSSAIFNVNITNNENQHLIAKVAFEALNRSPESCFSAIEKWEKVGIPIGKSSEVGELLRLYPHIGEEGLFSSLWKQVIAPSKQKSTQSDISERRQLVGILVKSGFTEVIDCGIEILHNTGEHNPKDDIFTDINAAIVAGVLVNNKRNSWAILRSEYVNNKEAGIRFLEALADRHSWNTPSFTKDLSEVDLFFLFHIGLENEKDKNDHGFVTAFDQLIEICIAAGQELLGRGTDSSLSLLGKAKDLYPDSFRTKLWLEEAKKINADNKILNTTTEDFKRDLDGYGKKFTQAQLFEAQNPEPEPKLKATKIIKIEDSAQPLTNVPKDDKLDRTINVLLLATEWGSSKGGLSTLNRQLAIALAKSGHKVLCLVPNATMEEESDAKSCSVRLERLTIEAGTDCAHELDNFYHWDGSKHSDINSEQFGLVIGHDHITGRHAIKLAKKLSTKSAIVFHTIPEEIEQYKSHGFYQASVKVAEKNKVRKGLVEEANVILAVGDNIKNSIVKNNPHASVYKLTPPLNGELIGITALPLTSSTPITFYYVGRMEDEVLKGWDILIRAYKNLIDKNKLEPFDRKIGLVIRGLTTDLESKVKGFVEKVGLDRRHYEFRPYSISQEDLVDDFNGITCLIMPSRCEGYGLVGVDAISAKRSLLLTIDSGFFAELEALVSRDEKLAKSLENYKLDLPDDEDKAVEILTERMICIIENTNDAMGFAEDINQKAEPAWTSTNMIKSLQGWVNKEFK